MTPKQQVQRYLETGDHDSLCEGWPGCNLFEKAGKAEHVLRHALVMEVRRRAKGRRSPSLPPDFNPCRFILGKVGPMVRGLFPAGEQQIMLGLFENSLQFVTRENIEQMLIRIYWPGTAWSVANLYLGSLGLPGLDGKPVCFVGLSEETTFYVSMDYFSEENPFADYVVHEAAHVFHNWKRDRDCTTRAIVSSCSKSISLRGNFSPMHAKPTAGFWSRQETRPTDNASSPTMWQQRCRMMTGSTELNWSTF